MLKVRAGAQEDLPKRKIELGTELGLILKNPLIPRSFRIKEDWSEEK
jgi:hypothetical protein